EPGWFQPWMFSSSSPTVVNSGQAEGDGALFFSGTSGAQRILAQPLSGVRTVLLRLKIANSAVTGQGVNLYMRQFSTGDVGPNWQASADGHFRVVDGMENGSQNLLDTGILWTPGA